MNEKKKMEVFFDYSCPYCLKGHGYLEELHSNYPEIEFVWCPCEAHPHPEPGPHTDLVLQGLFFALENEVDIWEFHRRMYQALAKDKIDRYDVNELARRVEDILDAKEYKKALRERKYEKVQKTMNDYAYEKSGVWYIPSFRMDGHKLDAAGGVGVTKEQLKKFMDIAKK